MSKIASCSSLDWPLLEEAAAGKPLIISTGGKTLSDIDKLNRRYPDITIGYSGHEDPDDNTVPMLAIAKGAKILERHVGLPTETITLNAYSVNPEQAEKWVASAIQARTICGMKKSGEKYISQEELDSLNSLMRGVYVKRDVKEEEELTGEDVFFAMPCHEKQMTSGEFYEGVVAHRDYKANEELPLEMILR